MRRSVTSWGGQKFRVSAPSVPLAWLGAAVLLAIGALHVAAVVMGPNSARAFLSPRYNLAAAVAFLGLIAIGTMSIKLLTVFLVAAPATQLGTVSIAGIAFNPTIVLSAALCVGLLFQLFNGRSILRREWTVTGSISLLTLGAAITAVALSSFANGQGLSDCTPWLVAVAVGWSLILSARFGYLSSSTIPVALVAGFAISATYDLQSYVRGTGIAATGPHAGRFVGGLGDFELLGEFYAAAIVIALATLIHVRRLTVALLALYVIGLGLVLVFATQSRSPVILLAIACPLLVTTLFIGRTASRPRVVLIVAVAAAASMASAPLISSSNTVARLLTIVDNGDFTQTINRSSVWPFVVSDPKFASSGLFGNGPVGIFEWLGTYPHSLVLWTIWSLGVFGCIFLALLAATGISGIVQWWKHNWVTPSLGFTLIVLLADEIVIEFPRQGSMILFVLALSALVGAASISEKGGSVGHSAE